MAVSIGKRAVGRRGAAALVISSVLFLGWPGTTAHAAEGAGVRDSGTFTESVSVQGTWAGVAVKGGPFHIAYSCAGEAANGVAISTTVTCQLEHRGGGIPVASSTQTNFGPVAVTEGTSAAPIEDYIVCTTASATFLDGTIHRAGPTCI